MDASTLLVVALWALPIVVGIVLMITRYEPPEEESAAARPRGRS